MARERDEALWAEWRGRVVRYERRAETSAEFCRREGVSVTSLFSWRRRLATETAMTKSVAAPTLRPTTPTFSPVRLSTRQLHDAEVDGRVEIELPDIREYARTRKISAGTRSDIGRRCRDTFLSLKKTCRKLGVSFCEYLLDRLAGTGAIRRLSELMRMAADAGLGATPQPAPQSG